ncbi:MAG: gamma-glutamylcyclotransferase [bacterium]|nr:gamma-glutamylcyclotransferase [bacterium]
MQERLNYFAYGSNLHPARLEARIGRCQFQGIALLEQADLRFHKVGVDASGKCDITIDDTSAGGVWGAVYQITTEQKTELDRFESLGQGYEIREVDVLTHEQHLIRVFTYQAMTGFIDPTLQPFDWYHDLVLRGARFHGFPAEYLTRLQLIKRLTDFDAERITLAQETLRTIEEYRDRGTD